MGIPVTVVGSIVGQDGIQLKFGGNGQAVVNFSVMEKDRKYDRETSAWVDGDPSYYRVSAFGKLAENIAESCERLTRVIVTGKLFEREYEKDGETRRVWQLTADDVAVSLKWDIARVERQDGPQQSRPQQNRRPQQDTAVPF